MGNAEAVQNNNINAPVQQHQQYSPTQSGTARAEAYSTAKFETKGNTTVAFNIGNGNQSIGNQNNDVIQDLEAKNKLTERGWQVANNSGCHTAGGDVSARGAFDLAIKVRA